MVRITYIDLSGTAQTLDIPVGWSLMQGAVTHGVDGIVAECGGSLVCATCHCYIQPERLDDLTPPSDDELELLKTVAAERRSNSRLSCQIKACEKLEGLIITVPDTQG